MPFNIWGRHKFVKKSLGGKKLGGGGCGKMVKRDQRNLKFLLFKNNLYHKKNAKKIAQI